MKKLITYHAVSEKASNLKAEKFDEETLVAELVIVAESEPVEPATAQVVIPEGVLSDC